MNVVVYSNSKVDTNERYWFGERDIKIEAASSNKIIIVLPIVIDILCTIEDNNFFGITKNSKSQGSCDD